MLYAGNTYMCNKRFSNLAVLDVCSAIHMIVDTFRTSADCIFSGCFNSFGYPLPTFPVVNDNICKHKMLECQGLQPLPCMRKVAVVRTCTVTSLDATTPLRWDADVFWELRRSAVRISECPAELPQPCTACRALLTACIGSSVNT